MVITTGGTGFTGRDVTPEALEPIFEKRMDGFSEVFHRISYDKIGTSTIQSRATGGVVNATFVFVLPGSPGACKDAWDGILKAQLDYRHMPCNFVEIMPRLDEHLRRGGRQERLATLLQRRARRDLGRQPLRRQPARQRFGACARSGQRRRLPLADHQALRQRAVGRQARAPGTAGAALRAREKRAGIVDFAQCARRPPRSSLRPAARPARAAAASRPWPGRYPPRCRRRR